MTFIGTLLTINSGDLRNQDSFVALMKIVAATDAKLDAALKSTAPGSQEEEAVAAARDEFDKSVEAFWATRGEAADSVDPSTLDQRSAGVLINRQWRPVFEQALSTMEKVISAYNKKAGTKIELTVDHLPTNICRVVARESIGKVVFRKDISWTIVVRYIGEPQRGDVPELRIVLDHGSLLGEPSAGEVALNFDHRAKQFWIENNVYRLPKKPRLSQGKYTMKDFQSVWETNLVELVGQQDLLLE